MAVDDRQSSTQHYRILQVGRADDGGMSLQVIIVDLFKGFKEANQSLSQKVKCATDIKMKEDLIVIMCTEDHTITVFRIEEKATSWGLVMMSQKKFF